MLALAEDAPRDCRRRRSCVRRGACVDADSHGSTGRLGRRCRHRRAQRRAGAVPSSSAPSAARSAFATSEHDRARSAPRRSGPGLSVDSAVSCCARSHASQPDRAAGALLAGEDRSRRRLARKALRPAGRRRDGRRRDGERAPVLCPRRRGSPSTWKTMRTALAQVLRDGTPGATDAADPRRWRRSERPRRSVR